MSQARRRVERAVRRGLPALARPLTRPRHPAPVDPASVRHVLVIRQHNQLGDMLCVVPLLRALRAQWPEARIDLLGSPVNSEVMRGHRLLSEVLVYDKTEYLGRRGLRFGRILDLCRDLRQRRYDLVVVPATVSMSLTSDLLAVLTGAPVRIGPGSMDGTRNTSGFLYTHPVELDWRDAPGRHQTLRNADILRDLLRRPDDLSHEMTLTEQERQSGRETARQLRGRRKHLVVIHPGAGKAPNRWPAASFGRLVEDLCTRFDASVAVTIGPMDGEVRILLESLLSVEVNWLIDRPIRHVASVLAYARLVVSNDTGIMHVAAAVGAPLLSLFGPTDPRQWAPLGPESRYIHGNPMESISVDAVLSEAAAMLQGSTDRRIAETSEELR